MVIRDGGFTAPLSLSGLAASL